ncbi:MAG: prepilin peptidase [Gemmatimonadales bacterium]|nr:prepilin peptidase [Gemmatimonadales bacterium]
MPEGVALAALPPAFAAAVALVTGAFLGSFLNVAILRWAAEESVLRPARSHCPRCGALIAWHDNIPVLSWLALRGRCRRCAAPISAMYPLVEAATALAWMGCVLAFGASLEALRTALLFTILLGIAVTDARERLIPHEFTAGGGAIGLASAFALGGLEGAGQALLGAVAGYLSLRAVAWVGEWWLGKEAMGHGDATMMAMVGTFTGWLGVYWTIFLGAVLATLVYLPLKLLDRDGRLPIRRTEHGDPEIAFGVFLAIAAAGVHLGGDRLWAWYVGLVGL